MKIKGAELKAFMDEAWPQPENDWYWDHEEFANEPVATAVYDTNNIDRILYQGCGQDPTEGNGYDLAALIRQWRKDRKYVSLVVSVPKDRVDAFKKSLKDFGAKPETGG